MTLSCICVLVVVFSPPNIEELSVRSSAVPVWTLLTFAHADGAALPVLSVAVAAVLVAGEGGTFDAAAHLTAVLVPPAGRHAQRTHYVTEACANIAQRWEWRVPQVAVSP